MAIISESEKLIANAMGYVFGNKNCGELNLVPSGFELPEEDDGVFQDVKDGFLYKKAPKKIQGMLADGRWPKVLKKIRNDPELTRLFVDKVGELTVGLKKTSLLLRRKKEKIERLGKVKDSNFDELIGEIEEKIKKCEIIAKHAISILGTLNFNIVSDHRFTLAVPSANSSEWTQSEYKVKRLVLRKWTGHDGWGFIPTSKNEDGQINPALLVLSGTIPIPAAGIGMGHNVFATIYEDLMLGSSLGAAATREDRNTDKFGKFRHMSLYGPSEDLNNFVNEYAKGEGKEVIAFGQSLGGAGAVSFVQEMNRRNQANRRQGNKDDIYNISASVVNPPLACTNKIKYFTRACAAVAIGAVVLSILYFSLPIWAGLLIGLGVYSVGFIAYKAKNPKNEWLAADNIHSYRSVTGGKYDWAGLVGDRHIGNLTHIKANENDGSIVRNHFRSVCRLNLDDFTDLDDIESIGEAEDSLDDIGAADGIEIEKDTSIASKREGDDSITRGDLYAKKQLDDIQQDRRYNLSPETIVWLSRAPVFWVFLLVGIIPHSVGSMVRYLKSRPTGEDKNKAEDLSINQAGKHIPASAERRGDLEKKSSKKEQVKNMPASPSATVSSNNTGGGTQADSKRRRLGQLKQQVRQGKEEQHKQQRRPEEKRPIGKNRRTGKH